VRLVARRGVRGLRIEELAQEAGVSQGLIYYHFGDRAGLLSRTFAFVNERAGDYTQRAETNGATPDEQLELKLLLELQDDPQVIENSTAWGELRASAKFDPDLRQALRDSTADWVGEIAHALELARGNKRARPKADALAAAERLTSLVEGLSDRWLSGSIRLGRAQRLLRDAVVLELENIRRC